MKELYHFSRKPLNFNQNFSYNVARDQFFKPHGLWLSDESKQSIVSWRSWCIAEDYSIDALSYRTKFLVDTNKIIVLSTLKDIDNFTNKYKDNTQNYTSNYIDWKKVISISAGILITPYIWEARNDHKYFWYYPWDCASACIWDLSAVKLLE